MIDELSIKNSFDILANEIGVYNAINSITESARTLAQYCDNRISEGEAITWAVTGIEPEKSKIYRILKSRNTRMSYGLKYVMSVVNDVLSGVEDSGVCKSVRASVKASNESKSEVFIYIDIDDSEGKHSRVRILTRMILDELWEGSTC